MTTPVGTANVFCPDSEASGARAESPAGAYVFVVTRRLKPCHGGQQDVGHKGVATRRGSLSLCTPLKRKSVVILNLLSPILYTLIIKKIQPP